MSFPDPAHPETRSRPYIDYIDGLRFIAVILVLLFHLGFSTFSGGYVGVDVFFVISGFLMTSILAAKEPSWKNLLSFFRSRGKRIFPAYIAATSAIAILSCLLLLPFNLKQIAWGLILAPLFLTNFAFWRQTDYFSTDLAQNTMLHTWSLGVEWQFYLVFPILFILARRCKIAPWILLVLATIGSFGLSVIESHTHIIAAFYLLPTRVWEFTIGGLAAIGFLPRLRRGLFAEVVSVAGFGLIVWSALTYTKGTLFPGLSAAAPCLGAALIIYGCAPGTFTSRVLSLPPIRLIGQASYSIYLWHWPIIILLRYRFSPLSTSSSFAFNMLIIVLSILAGIASWHYIEKPFRKMPASAIGRKQVLQAALVSLIPLIIGFMIIRMDGLPGRFSPASITASSEKNDAGNFRDCLSREITGKVADLCHLGTPDVTPSFVLLGDSHAAALADGIDAVASAAGKSGIMLVTDACAPVLKLEGNYLPTRRRCGQVQAYIPDLLAQVKPETVILGAAWHGYYNDNRERLAGAIDTMFDFLKQGNFDVVVIDDVPGARADVPLELGRHYAYGVKTPLEFKKTDYVNDNKAVNDLLQQYTGKYQFRYIDLGGRMCGAEMCPVEMDGKPIYWDNAHLSGFGSRYIGKYLGDVLK